MWHQGKKTYEHEFRDIIGLAAKRVQDKKRLTIGGASSALERHASGEKQSGAPRRASVGSGSVLLVGHLLHPIDGFAIEFFLDGNMGHSRGLRRPVPMFLPRRKPDHVAGPDLLDWT